VKSSYSSKQKRELSHPNGWKLTMPVVTVQSVLVSGRSERTKLTSIGRSSQEQAIHSTRPQKQCRIAQGARAVLSPEPW
jgi:hypothetical protein